MIWPVQSRINVRSLLIASVSTACLHCWPGTARAVEGLPAYPVGITEGVALGALPPPGFYVFDTLAYQSSSFRNGAGHRIPVSVDALYDLGAVLWASDLQLLGGRYSALMAQAVGYGSLSSFGAKHESAGVTGTLLFPLRLSWQLSDNLFTTGSFGTLAPHGGFRARAPLNFDIGYWALEPTVTVSWLQPGLELTAHVTNVINMTNPSTHYRSGDAVYIDYTVLRPIDKWAVGISGYAAYQFEDDTVNGASVAASPFNGPGSRYRQFATGPLIGYDFGPLSVTGYYNRVLFATNAPKGDNFWLRVAVPF